MVSTFLKSFSVSTPLLDEAGASTSIATPSANNRSRPRPAPALRSGARAGAVTTRVTNFHAAVAPIGSTSKKFTPKHSAPRPGLLGVQTGTASFLAAKHALSDGTVPARFVVLGRLLCIICAQEEQGCG